MLFRCLQLRRSKGSQGKQASLQERINNPPQEHLKWEGEEYIKHSYRTAVEVLVVTVAAVVVLVVVVEAVVIAV